MSFWDIGFIRLDQPVQLRFLYGFLQESQQLLAHEKRSGMAYSDILSTIVYGFQGKSILNEHGPFVLVLVGVRSDLTGIIGKFLSASLALIQQLSAGEGFLDKSGFGAFAARADFEGGIIQFILNSEEIFRHLANPADLIFAKLPDHLHQFCVIHSISLHFYFAV